MKGFSKKTGLEIYLGNGLRQTPGKSFSIGVLSGLTVWMKVLSSKVQNTKLDANGGLSGKLILIHLYRLCAGAVTTDEYHSSARFIRFAISVRHPILKNCIYIK